MRIIQQPSLGTLIPDRDESVDFDTTGNVVIEGDNLEVLKLLQNSYYGRVKMIYIDPPYNTGNDFIYPDDFSEGLTDYLQYTGQLTDTGTKRTTNIDVSGRLHRQWLNMILPRLFLARNLLQLEGIIAVSIDDNESSSLRFVMDEIFGEENFLANVVWKHTEQSKNDEKYFSRQHNSVLIYGRSEQVLPFNFARTTENNSAYRNPDGDAKGQWRAGDVRSPSLRPSLMFNITSPSGHIIRPPENGWRWSEATIKEKTRTGEIVFSADERRIVRKIYLADQVGRTPENLWTQAEAGTTREANTELKSLFGDVPFDTAKPTRLRATGNRAHRRRRVVGRLGQR